MRKFKKMLAGIIGMTVLATSGVFAGTTASSEQVLLGYRGDLDWNSTLNNDDYEILSSYLLGKTTLGEEFTLNADLTGDNRVDAFDAALLKRCLKGDCEWKGIYEEVPDPTEPPTQETTETPTEVPTEPPTEVTTESPTDPPETTVSTTVTTTATTVTTTQPAEGRLIDAPIRALDAATPTTGDVRMLAIYVDFADETYSSSAYSNEQIKNELFGDGQTAYPYESLTAWFERSSYGNLHLDGDVYRYTCSGNISEYESGGYEKMVMEVLSGLDSQINYADYDADGDGVIDCLSFTVPLDNADETRLQYWYGCTSTWYENAGYRVDNMQLHNYIIMDVMPYASNMQYMKQTYIHEMGHSMGLPDYYKYDSADWEGLHGDAGYERMDDSIADFCSFSKLMCGWLKDTEVQSYTGSGARTFALKDASQTGSCLILPISSDTGDYTSEYFLLEYFTPNGNNSDAYTSSSGIRIFHVQAELYTEEWGYTNFKYQNYSSQYMGDDGPRVLKLVNDNGGFYTTGASVNYGTSNFAGYDSSGNQTVDTGYIIQIGALTDDGYSVTISKN